MTDQQKTDYWHKWHRFQQRYEKMFIAKLRAALNQQVESFITTRNLLSIPSTPIYNVLVELYRTTGVQWAAKIRLDIRSQKARMPMGFSERIVELMRQYYGIDLLNDAEGITNTTRQYIQEVLSQAAETGWSFDEIVKRLRSKELNDRRARLIARTETVTAANGAAVVYAEETGLPMNKVWIAVRDKRTRDAHRAVDNVTVDLKSPFDVSGFQMQQPGVRTADNGLAVPGELVINCRCVVAFEVRD